MITIESLFIKWFSSFVLVIGTGYGLLAQSPTFLIIEKLPYTEWSKQEKGANLSDEEKLEMLTMLPKGERVEFVYEEGETPEETTYYELNLYGLKFLDLDFDGDLDLLYSSLRSGGMGQLSTKVYYNINNVLKHQKILRNGLIDIKKNKDSYEIYTQFHPCCDSYTTRIETHIFSATDTAVFKESISLIGRSYYRYKGMPDFDTEKIGSIQNPSIYALPTDFKSVHGYFRERNKEVRAIIKSKEILELLKVEGKVKIGVLKEATFREELYYLVITEPLNHLPKMPTSLYEWSQGNGRRLVGWVKAEEVE